MLNHKADTNYSIKLFVFFFVFSSAIACQRDETITKPTDDNYSSFDAPPEWAKHAIWYQIFVERFYNGDPSNDPTGDAVLGAYPGFVPEGWTTTSWTHDWYADDAYLKTISDSTLNRFGQKSQLRRYGGDLQGVLDQLNYLDSLGISAIYFNPLNDAPSLHKYDARQWRHVDKNFGPNPESDVLTVAKEIPDDPSTWQFTEADKLFLKVIDALHAQGIKVIMDYSWNHTGKTFWAWQDVVKNQSKSKYADWYWVKAFDDPKTPESEFDYSGWFGVKDLPELKETQFHDYTQPVKAFEGNLSSESARQHIFAVTRRWLDPNGDGDPSDGVDGYRLDVAAEVPLGFWREFRQVVKTVNPEAYLVGEVWWEAWPDRLLEPAPFLKGDVFDAVMNYRWYRSARHFLNASPDELSVVHFLDSLDKFRQSTSIERNQVLMNLLGSHDTPRVLTSLYNKNAYKMDSDPEKNPEFRINRPDESTFETLRLLLIHQFTYVGAPHIWAGDEMGMWGADDPNCRKPLIWPEFDFEPERAHPLGQKRIPDAVKFDVDLYRFYQRLIALRNRYEVLRTGDFIIEALDVEKNVLVYSRGSGNERIYIALNAGGEAYSFYPPFNLNQNYTDVLAASKVMEDGRLELTARKGSIFVRKLLGN